VRHLPNLICVLRILLVWPVIAEIQDRHYLAALAFFLLAAVSDGLDGYLAKHFHWTSELGKLLDPLADKLLLVAGFVEGAWRELIPWWLTAAVVARDVMIALGALIFRLWFGPLHGRPTPLSKINTAAQLLYVLLVLLASALQRAAHGLLQAAAVVVFATTLISGAHYLLTFTRRAWHLPARAH
jgi:cardiolipin synthase